MESAKPFCAASGTSASPSARDAGVSELARVGERRHPARNGEVGPRRRLRARGTRSACWWSGAGCCSAATRWAANRDLADRTEVRRAVRPRADEWVDELATVARQRAVAGGGPAWQYVIESMHYGHSSELVVLFSLRRSYDCLERVILGDCAIQPSATRVVRVSSEISGGIPQSAPAGQRAGW